MHSYVGLIDQSRVSQAAMNSHQFEEHSMFNSTTRKIENGGQNNEMKGFPSCEYKCSIKNDTLKPSLNGTMIKYSDHQKVEFDDGRYQRGSVTSETGTTTSSEDDRNYPCSNEMSPIVNECVQSKTFGDSTPKVSEKNIRMSFRLPGKMAQRLQRIAVNRPEYFKNLGIKTVKLADEAVVRVSDKREEESIEDPIQLEPVSQVPDDLLKLIHIPKNYPPIIKTTRRAPRGGPRKKREKMVAPKQNLPQKPVESKDDLMKLSVREFFDRRNLEHRGVMSTEILASPLPPITEKNPSPIKEEITKQEPMKVTLSMKLSQQMDEVIESVRRKSLPMPPAETPKPNPFMIPERPFRKGKFVKLVSSGGNMVNAMVYPVKTEPRPKFVKKENPIQYPTQYSVTSSALTSNRINPSSSFPAPRLPPAYAPPQPKTARFLNRKKQDFAMELVKKKLLEEEKELRYKQEDEFLASFSEDLL